jgi:predicted dehydrogenase
MTFRIGLLGAAAITPRALVEPAVERGDVRLVAVAARDRRRAADFAAEHGVEGVVDDYAALVTHPEVDAVYNPLPISLHAEWSIAALEAGKHVLCEKPIAMNKAEAVRMRDAARASGRLLMEGFHWRFHPMAARILELVAGLGPLHHIEAEFSARRFAPDDIRMQLHLGGGALMDLGCYVVHWVRTVAGAEPVVVAAHARTGPPGVDVDMRASLELPGGVTAGLRSASRPGGREARLVVEGERGRLVVENPLAPQVGNRIVAVTDAGTVDETVDGPTSFRCQLDAFVAAAVDGTPALVPVDDSVANMAVIDAIYRAAGLPVRGAVQGTAPETHRV